MKRILILLAVCFLPFYSFALNVEEPLPDKPLESRAQALFYQIRCVVCQGESIADSPAQVATDIRREVRKSISDGKSDKEILEMLVAAYGEKILMKPPFKPSTWILWFSPLILLLIGALFITKFFYRQSNKP